MPDSQMLPTGTAALRRGRQPPPYPEAFADAMVANFPQHPTIDQKRNGYVEILVRSGVPFDEAMQQAELAIPGSAMIPVRAPAPHELGRGQDTEMIHVRPDEIPAIQEALDFPGTVNPRTGYLEFGGGGGAINGPGGSGNVGGGGRGNAGGGGIGNTGKGERSRVNDRPGTQHSPWGNRATTAAGAPVHSDKYGNFALTDTRWNALTDQVSKYNSAAHSWNKGAGRSLANFVNALSPMGFSMQAPELGKPKTYVDGDYHLGLNPGELAGGLLGGALVPGGGIPGAIVGGKLYDATGLGNVMLGGGPVPAGWRSGLGEGDRPGLDRPGDTASTGPQSPGRGDASGSRLLPALSGGSPGAVPAPAPGGVLPPIAPPVSGGTNPAAFMPIPGPSPYGWRRPAWTFS